MKVCFIGHRKIDNVDGLTAKLYDTVYELIANGADTFLFGSKSEFNSVCWNAVSALKQQYSFMMLYSQAFQALQLQALS